MAVVVIPARYASTRLPGKPLAKINGVPMILRVAENCMKSIADRVIVATDNQEILQVCEKMDGLESVMSPEDIQTGTDRVARVAKYLQDDVIINVQGDEPFIDPELINALVKDLEDNKDAHMNTACVKFTEDEDPNNPNVVKVVKDVKGNALYFSRSAVPFDRDGSKPTYFKHIGIYGFNRKFLMEYAGMEESGLEKSEKLEQLRALENGYKIRVVETDYNPISVDTPEDLEKCEKYLTGMKNG